MCLGLPSVPATQQGKVYYSFCQGVLDDFLLLLFLQVKQKPAQAVRETFFLLYGSLMQTSICVVTASRNHQSQGRGRRLNEPYSLNNAVHIAWVQCKTEICLQCTTGSVLLQFSVCNFLHGLLGRGLG